MALDHIHFPLINALGIDIGDGVRYRTPKGTGEGTITKIWLGIEECVEVTDSEGFVARLYPALGDTIYRRENPDD